MHGERLLFVLGFVLLCFIHGNEAYQRMKKSDDYNFIFEIGNFMFKILMQANLKQVGIDIKKRNM